MTLNAWPNKQIACDRNWNLDVENKQNLSQKHYEKEYCYSYFTNKKVGSEGLVF